MYLCFLLSVTHMSARVAGLQSDSKDICHMAAGSNLLLECHNALNEMKLRSLQFYLSEHFECVFV